MGQETILKETTGAAGSAIYKTKEKFKATKKSHKWDRVRNLNPNGSGELSITET